MPAFAVGSLPVPYSYRHSAVGALVAPTAEAKKLRERARSLLDRIRGSSMPKGIVKTMAASKPHRSIVRLERNPPKTLSPAGVDEAPGSGD